MKHSHHYSVVPFVFLTFVYFLVGFLTTINGQFQGPLKIAFLSDAGEMKNTFTTLISFFFFLGYLLNSSVAGRWIDNHGYKSTMLRALVCMIVGLLLYDLAAYIVVNHSDVRIHYKGGTIPWGFVVFLFGSFLMGTSAAILQVVINPYVSAYDLPGTRPAQRLNIVTAVNSFGTTIAPFFLTMVVFSGVSLDDITASQLLIPFLIIAGIIALVTAFSSKISLPDLSHTHADSNQNLSRSIWSFRHLTLGVIAIFFYVGTEVSIGSNINLHAMELHLGSGIPSLLATLYWGGFLVGRFVSTFFRNFNPRKILIVTTIIASVLIIISIYTENLWFLAAVGLFHSVMWSCIFTLSTRGLREYTSKASGVFMMGVFGGAVFPVAQGFLSDLLCSWQYTWSIALICEIVMLLYGLYGYNIKDKWCLDNLRKITNM
ncbi:MAG: sugar MFS transporter [Prevotella sp.]|jgi:FHS family L-fucose permease-like MFS transporter|nr:sugar MFS transporter [Prevotella sp.]